MLLLVAGYDDVLYARTGTLLAVLRFVIPGIGDFLLLPYVPVLYSHSELSAELPPLPHSYYESERAESESKVKRMHKDRYTSYIEFVFLRYMKPGLRHVTFENILVFDTKKYAVIEIFLRISLQASVRNYITSPVLRLIQEAYKKR